jgi:hypothetical protein
MKTPNKESNPKKRIYMTQDNISPQNNQQLPNILLSFKELLSTFGPKERVVFWKIWFYCWRYKERGLSTFVRQKTIAEKCKVSLITVERVIRKLKKNNFLKITRAPQKKCLYFLAEFLNIGDLKRRLKEPSLTGEMTGEMTGQMTVRDHFCKTKETKELRQTSKGASTTLSLVKLINKSSSVSYILPKNQPKMKKSGEINPVFEGIKIPQKDKEILSRHPEEIILKSFERYSLKTANGEPKSMVRMLQSCFNEVVKEKTQEGQEDFIHPLVATLNMDYTTKVLASTYPENVIIDSIESVGWWQRKEGKAPIRHMDAYFMTVVRQKQTKCSLLQASQ